MLEVKKNMTDEVRQDLEFLSFFTQNTDYLVVLFIIVIFVLLVVIVLRVNEDTIFHESGAITRCEIKMEHQTCNLRNPFSVSISTDHKFLEISLENASEMYILWGVIITEFFIELRQPWLNIVEALRAGNWMKDSALLAVDETLEFKSGKHRYKLDQPEQASAEKLGLRPRTRYPVIVVTVLKDTEIEIGDFPKIVAMFSVLHVQDSICSGETQVLYQYLKTSHDQVVCLQPLFVPQTEDEGQQQTEMTSATSQYSTQSNTNNGEPIPEAQNVRENSDERNNITHRNNDNSSEEKTSECVVCQNNEVTIAILPCRHTCICDLCLEQLDKCPMCRGYIMSYFKVGQSSDMPSHHDHDNQGRLTSENRRRVRQPGESHWEYYNRRLNQFLGFE